jgi:hypothetical protein
MVFNFPVVCDTDCRKSEKSVANNDKMRLYQHQQKYIYEYIVGEDVS